jgi:hypothetical protein
MCPLWLTWLCAKSKYSRNPMAWWLVRQEITDLGLAGCGHYASKSSIVKSNYLN